MKLQIKNLSFLMPLLFLTGCYDNSSPSRVIKSVAVAIEKNDIKQYSSFFTGRAAQQYGNAQGMQILRNKGIDKKAGLKLSKEVLLSRQVLNARAYNSSYSLNISENGRLLAETEVFCSSIVRHETSARECTRQCTNTPNGGQRCFTSCSGGTSRNVTTTDCAISELKLR